MSTHDEANTSDPRAGGGGEVRRFDLTEREQAILRFVVERFIETAGPIGSRTVAREHPGIDLSSASVRNTMSDLERRGFLDQPHTSAGRRPTERGYRAFVDELMEQPRLAAAEQQAVRAVLSKRIGDVDDLLRESTRLLGRLTDLLGVVLSPRLSTSVLERLELVPLAGGRLMFVLSVNGGLVKTLVLEAEAEENLRPDRTGGSTPGVRRHDLARIVSILNERLGGLTLAEIRRTFEERTGDLAGDRSSDPAGVIRLMRDEAALLFSEPAEGRLRHGGTQGLMAQPEFQEVDDLRALIEMVEDEDRVVRLLEEVADLSEGEAAADTTREGVPREGPRWAERLQAAAASGGDEKTGGSALPGDPFVSIGSEHRAAGAERVEQYSVVTAHFRRGDAVGAVGVLGPTRMDYGRVMALVENTARLMSRADA